MKDDSGAYAIFTEQGSSASQMTAGKKEDAQKTTEHSQIRMSGYMDTSSKTSGRSRGNILKIPWFLLNETYTDTHSKDSCGKDRSKKH